jgi:hypothetical protein
VGPRHQPRGGLIVADEVGRQPGLAEVERTKRSGSIRGRIRLRGGAPRMAREGVAGEVEIGRDRHDGQRSAGTLPRHAPLPASGS